MVFPSCNQGAGYTHMFLLQGRAMETEDPAGGLPPRCGQGCRASRPPLAKPAAHRPPCGHRVSLGSHVCELS